ASAAPDHRACASPRPCKQLSRASDRERHDDGGPLDQPCPPAVKGIIHVPAHNTPIKASRREALLIAIAKARRWIDDLAHGRAASFALIARREGKVERHIRLLAPLAFVSPRIVSALLDGTAPADLTLTKLARALPYCWAEQERRVGTSAS